MASYNGKHRLLKSAVDHMNKRLRLEPGYVEESCGIATCKVPTGVYRNGVLCVVPLSLKTQVVHHRQILMDANLQTSLPVVTIDPDYHPAVWYTMLKSMVCDCNILLEITKQRLHLNIMAYFGGTIQEHVYILGLGETEYHAVSYEKAVLGDLQDVSAYIQNVTGKLPMVVCLACSLYTQSILQIRLDGETSLTDTFRTHCVNYHYYGDLYHDAAATNVNHYHDYNPPQHPTSNFSNLIESNNTKIFTYIDGLLEKFRVERNDDLYQIMGDLNKTQPQQPVITVQQNEQLIVQQPNEPAAAAQLSYTHDEREYQLSCNNEPAVGNIQSGVPEAEIIIAARTATVPASVESQHGRTPIQQSEPQPERLPAEPQQQSYELIFNDAIKKLLSNKTNIFDIIPHKCFCTKTKKMMSCIGSLNSGICRLNKCSLGRCVVCTNRMSSPHDHVFLMIRNCGHPINNICLKCICECAKTKPQTCIYQCDVCTTPTQMVAFQPLWGDPLKCQQCDKITLGNMHVTIPSRPRFQACISSATTRLNEKSPNVRFLVCSSCNEKQNTAYVKIKNLHNGLVSHPTCRLELDDSEANEIRESLL